MTPRGSRDPDRNKQKSIEGKRQQSSERDSLVIVTRRGVTRRRVGRGYSIKEIHEAFQNVRLGNPNIAKARSFGLPVDTFRRSAHLHNVTNLTAVLKKYKENRKPRSSNKKRSSDEKIRRK
jgi:ribosomal protein L13E